MRTTTTLLACLLGAGLLTAQDKSPWLTDFEQAKAALKAPKRAVMVFFTGADELCKNLETEVLSKKEFLTWADANVVLLRVDCPDEPKPDDAAAKKNLELRDKMGVMALPAVVFADATGKELGRIAGLVLGGPAKFLEQAEEELKPKVAPPPQKSLEEMGWTSNFDEAIARAKKEKKLVLANFTGSDWCTWCIRLKKEVFDKPEFAAWAEKRVVLLVVDFPREKKLPEALRDQNNKLRKDYKIEGYPTILFLDPEKAEQLGQLGYEKGGVERWTALAEEQMKKDKDEDKDKDK